MQRLDLMQQLAHAATAGGQQPPQRARPRAPGWGAQAVVLAWFSVGVIASCVLGAGAVVGLRTLAAGAPAEAGAPAVASWSRTRADWDTVYMAIDRSQRSRVPLALQVLGADNGAYHVVMHSLPDGVKPSRGAPVGERTWVLRPTDLDGLYLTVDDLVPDAFDVKIAVLSSAGVATAGSTVQVRLVEMAPAAQAAVTVGAPAPHARPAQADGSESAGAEPTRAAAAASPARGGAARTGGGAGPQSARRTGPVVASTGSTSWPEGASGLGATQREPDRQASWWQMPPPAWSPFLVGQERP